MSTTTDHTTIAHTAHTAHTATDHTATERIAAAFVSFLETGVPPEGLFAEDVFVDFSLPQWRLQATGATDAVALRLAGHPAAGRVPRSRLDATATGFVLELEEEWEHGGQSWYCREMFRADVAGGSISDLSVYCTGDWDEAAVRSHRDAVRLQRP